MESAKVVTYREIVEGSTVERDYAITPQVYEAFLSAFDDRSPIHIDADHARAAGFADCVMHGAILNGFLSHFVGMVFPGALSLLLTVDVRYQQPSYLGDELRLSAKVAQTIDAQQVVVLHVSIFNRTRGYPAANGRLQVKVRES